MTNPISLLEPNCLSTEKIIIAGSRNFSNYTVMAKACDRLIAMHTALNPCEIILIGGGASGADELGKRYAEKNQWVYEEYCADWDLHGRAAGPIRNEKMVNDASALIAFWDGQSKGTRDVIQKALRVGLDVFVLAFY